MALKTALATTCGLLASGSTLKIGETIFSCQKKYRLILQTDGNLVLYAHPSNAVAWSPGLNGKGANKLVMQDDGNVVVYTVDGKPVWATATNPNKGAHLAVQDDGNVVVYTVDGKPLWASKDADKPTGPFANVLHGTIFGGAVEWVSNCIGSAGKAIGQGLDQLATSAAAIGKKLGKIPFVGPLLHGLWDGMTGVLTMANAVAHGQRLDKALFDYFKAQLADVKELGPYITTIISCIPGIGPLASAVIGTAIALAEGQNITEALLSGVEAAIPGGQLAAMAFKVGKSALTAALEHKPLAEVGLAAVEGIAEAIGIPIPPTVKEMLSTAVDMIQKLANGVKLDKALLDVAATHLPALLGPAAKGLLDQAGQAVGGVVTDAVNKLHLDAQIKIADTLISKGKELIPNLTKTAGDALHNGLSIGMTMGHALHLQDGMAKNLLNGDIGKTLLDTGRSVAGQAISKIAGKGAAGQVLGAVSNVVGSKDVGQALLDTGRDVAGKALGQIAGKGAAGQVLGAVANVVGSSNPGMALNNLANSGLSKAEQMAQTEVVKAARKLVPSNLQGGFDVGIGLMQHQISPFAFQTIRDKMIPNQQKGFDMACSLHIAKVVHPLPKNMNPTAAAGAMITHGIRGASKPMKRQMIATVIEHPVAKQGVAHALTQIQTAQEPWLYRFLELLGLKAVPHVVVAA